jgi:Tol biopolymer transport system component
MTVEGSAARKLAPAGSQAASSLTPGGSQPVWSPDGKKIAFARQYDTYVTDDNGSAVYERQSDIYVMNADGSGQRNLTRRAGRVESSPVWSPAQKK